MVKWMLDQQFRLGTLAGGLVLVAVITYLRFCGDVSLPGKPPPPEGPRGTQTQLLSQSAASPSVYKGLIESDASAAGVRTPTMGEMSSKFPYRVDEGRHALEPGDPPFEGAGLRLHVERVRDQVVLVIDNLTGTDVAYAVTTSPSTAAGSCSSVVALPHNAMVIAKEGSQRRSECVWRAGLSIIVTKVETMEVPPLAGWYLSQLPPALVGIENRIARGHRGVQPRERCAPVMSQVVRMGIERGEIGWRDLADFYARHRCQSYQFPSTYRAFKKDGERPIPATAGSM